MGAASSRLLKSRAENLPFSGYTIGRKSRRPLRRLIGGGQTLDRVFRIRVNIKNLGQTRYFENLVYLRIYIAEP